MLLQRVLSRLKEVRQGSLRDLADHLAIDPTAMRGILVMLEKKGRVRSVTGPSACGSCTKCDPAENEIYAAVLSKKT